MPYQMDSRPFSRTGFTLIELLVVVAILGVLTLVGYIAYSKLITQADAAQCMANMRSLHTALSAYVQNQRHWPQPPEELLEAENDDAWEDWWVDTLTPYGVTEATWQCPTLRRILVRSEEIQRPRIHYAPTPFDSAEMTPYRWSTQPWLVEMGNIHTRGAHILFPDGSIRVMNDLLPQPSPSP